MRKIFLDVTNAGQDDGLPTSVLRELSHLKSLEHKNIAKLPDVSTNDKLLEIWYEYCDMNLKGYIKKHFVVTNSEFRNDDNNIQGLNLEMIKVTMKQLLEGMKYWHENGLMHRNLKPQNILIQNNGGIKISDFTLSLIGTEPNFPYTPEDPKERERSTRETRRLWYRAPEMIFRKEIYSSEIDLWSIGCLLAEMALGELLFNGESEVEQLFKIFRFVGTPTEDLFKTIYKVSDETRVKVPN